MSDTPQPRRTNLSIDSAYEIVMEESGRLRTVIERSAPESCPLDSAHGRSLAEAVTASEDDPAFDRSAMDGYAIRHADLESSPGTLRVVGESAAGNGFSGKLQSGEAIAIMTGAEVPVGADTVVILENTRREGDILTVVKPAPQGANIRVQGENIRVGDEALPRNSLIQGLTVGILASMGVATPLVHRRPIVTILGSGTELVDIQEAPKRGQIRDSNRYVLAALSRNSGAQVVETDRIADSRQQLEDAIARGLDSDVLVLSGGVSAGAYDLVAPALDKLGVKTLFHKVAMKPGKPLLFARHADTLIFGLPGNPVSTYVTGILFLSPALQVLSGRPPGLFNLQAELTGELAATGRRETVHPAVLSQRLDGVFQVSPLEWRGSADQAAFARANCFIRRRAMAPALTAGELVRVQCLQMPLR